MKANVREDVSSISKMLFNRVSSPYKQHAIFKIVGDTGTGKSYTLLGILENISKLMANGIRLDNRTKIEGLGGSPEDYFNLDNVAIMTQEEVRRVTGRIKKFGLYDFDDIEVAANARRAMSDDNILLNDIIATFRPNQNVLGLTFPKNRMIDVVQREIAHYNIEMNDPFFERGFATGTLYIPQETQYGFVNTYPIWNNKIFKRHIFSLPSKRLIEEYDERRALIAKELEQDNVSMYGLKTETKKMKTFLAAQKAGICVEIPTIDRTKPTRHKKLNITDIVLNDNNDNNILGNEDGNGNGNSPSKLEVVDSVINDENYTIENNPDKRNNLDSLSGIIKNKRKSSYS